MPGFTKGSRHTEEAKMKISIASCKGGRYARWCDGYIIVLHPRHPNANSQGYILEHRLVMENKLGRYLTNSEVVHHKDGNRQNNDIENLELVTKSSHNSIHKMGNSNAKGKYRIPHDRKCSKCGSTKTWLSHGRPKWYRQGLGFICKHCYTHEIKAL